MNERETQPGALEAEAAEVLSLANLAAATRSRLNADAGRLSEHEYLALKTLTVEESLSVGEIQQRIGVLPAQMSRILKSLENRGSEPSCIARKINLLDRRRVDVCLTESGRRIFADYHKARIGIIHDFLANLDEPDRVIFMKSMRLFRSYIDRRLSELSSRKES